jgi:hypothetical protein
MLVDARSVILAQLVGNSADEVRGLDPVRTILTYQ